LQVGGWVWEEVIPERVFEPLESMGERERDLVLFGRHNLVEFYFHLNY
jgi:hypothetical protein